MCYRCCYVDVVIVYGVVDDEVVIDAAALVVGHKAVVAVDGDDVADVVVDNVAVHVVGVFICVIALILLLSLLSLSFRCCC